MELDEWKNSNPILGKRENKCNHDRVDWKKNILTAATLITRIKQSAIMYSIQQFESALQNVGILPGYDLVLGSKKIDTHRKSVDHATGYVEIEGKTRFHYWNDKGECFLYSKSGKRVLELDLTIK
jgi:hypothetical protein